MRGLNNKQKWRHKIESQVSNAGSVSGPGRLVDLHLKVVVAEFGVILKLKFDRQILEKQQRNIH